MDTDFCGPPLPPMLGQRFQSEIGSDLKRSDLNCKQSDHVPLVKPKKHMDKRKRKVRTKYVSSSSEESEASVQVHKSCMPKGASEQDKQQTDPDPDFYREVDMSDLPLQYAEQ